MTRHSARRSAVALALGLAAGAVLALPAEAANMDARFGNTLLGKQANGTTMKVYFDADHTFNGKLSVGFEGRTFLFGGTWRLDGDNLCVIQTKGIGIDKGVEKCSPLQGDKVGDSWEVSGTNLRGQATTTNMQIVAGR